MHEVLYAVVLGVTVFCATNIDAWALFVALFLPERRPRKRLLVSALLLGLLTLLGLGALGGAVARLLVPSYVRLLGIIPAALGVRGLVRGGDVVAPLRRAAEYRRLGQYVALVLATGLDNVSVFTVVFSRVTVGAGVLFGCVQIALAPSLVWAADVACEGWCRSRLVRVHQQRLSSVVFILVGAAVLVTG